MGTNPSMLNNNFDDRIKYLKNKEKTNEENLLKNYSSVSVGIGVGENSKERFFQDKASESDLTSTKNKWKNKKPIENYSKYNLAPLSSNEIYAGANYENVFGKKSSEIKLDFKSFEGVNNNKNRKKSESMNNLEFPSPLKNNDFASPIISQRISYNNFNKSKKSNFNFPKVFNSKINVNQHDVNKINSINESPKKIISFNKKNLMANTKAIFRNKRNNNENSFDNNNNNNHHFDSPTRSNKYKYNLAERSLTFNNNKSAT